MANKKRRKHKAQGHYCWACDRIRRNEKFSGRGHRRHLCQDCARRPKEELDYVQALRDLERCVTWEGIVPRKRRKTFERFLSHPNPRIRALAKEIQQTDRLTRFAMRHSGGSPFANPFEFMEGDTDYESALDDNEASVSLDEIPF